MSWHLALINILKGILILVALSPKKNSRLLSGQFQIKQRRVGNVRAPEL